ncbi:MAG: nucleotidyl transferase AbiEii/AbiGii toxin family protein [PVC group bacterium]
MKRKVLSNMAASVRQRLLNYAHQSGDEFQRVLDRYGVERFLFRLGQSPYADKIVLKGAMLFLKWAGELYRPTKDVDFLSFGSDDLEQAELFIREICSIPVEDDGVEFLPGTVLAELIREEQEYGGTRVTFQAKLGSARIHLRVDIGYGDAVTPEPVVEKFPTLLDMPAPVLRMYPAEAVIAEKYQTLVDLGMTNSRMKDFYDLWTLARDFAFDGSKLASAITSTFKRRQTPIPEKEPVALSDEFIRDDLKRTQWRAFLRKGPFKVTEDDLGKVINALREFLMPPSRALNKVKDFAGSWPPGGPWRKKSEDES